MELYGQWTVNLTEKLMIFWCQKLSEETEESREVSGETQKSSDRDVSQVPHECDMRV